MKTTFLLHGGRLRLDDVRNDTYFRRLTKDLVDGDELLHIAFARRKEDRTKVFEGEKDQITLQADSKIKVIAATEHDLIQQIKESKAVHITGGASPELIQQLQQYPDFLPSLSGKVIGASSAGACLFAKYYWYGEQNEVLKGLGALPIALFVHYGSSAFNATDEELEQLKPYAKDLELLKLEEAAWVERSVDL